MWSAYPQHFRSWSFRKYLHCFSPGHECLSTVYLSLMIFLLNSSSQRSGCSGKHNAKRCSCCHMRSSLYWCFSAFLLHAVLLRSWNNVRVCFLLWCWNLSSRLRQHPWTSHHTSRRPGRCMDSYAEVFRLFCLECKESVRFLLWEQIHYTFSCM